MIVGVVILAILGLGVHGFFNGVSNGAEKVLSNPVVKNATNQAEEFAVNVTKNVTSGIVDHVMPK